MSQIINVVSSGNINTYFTYDKLGNLTNVTDHAGNVTRIVYDSLGRKTSMTDPDMGTWTYAYDKAGRLTNQVDAKSQKIAFTFNDQIGRLTRKDVYNAAGTLAYSATYAYDTNVSGFTGWKGAMTGMVDKEGWVRTGFDERGRATNASRYLSKNTTTYTISTKYDDANNVLEVRYPTSTTVRIGYAYTNGILYRVKSIEGTGSTNEVFYQLGSLNELGQAMSYTTHSGKVTNSYTFFDNSKRLKTMKAARSGAGLQNLAYKFDKVSNIKGITDSQYSGTCAGSVSNLVYDDLHRLTSLSHAGGSRSYAYNALGNMLTNSDSGSAQYKYGSKPHAVTNANGVAYSYDPNGNMVTRGGDTLSYDEENRLIQADASSTSFGYADGGARLWKQPVGGLQVWIGGIYEEKGGKTLCHVFAGGKRLATFEPASGGPYASIWSPKTWWARGGEWATAATAWPFQHNRTPATVLVTTLLAIFFLSITARRGWRWNPNATILQGLRQLATLAHRMGEGLGVRARGVEKTGMRADQSSRSRRGNEPVIFSEENCEPPHVGCYELTKRERRWFTQPIWRQAISVLLMVALIFTTTPTHVQAQTYTPVFYYYVGDHLGSSNVMTDRAGVLVEHYEYTAFGFAKCSTGTAFQVSNRYTGQVLDEETGLYYYGSRYYDSALGRFIQPDTMVPDPSDSQQFNRYSYVVNNPLKYTDPTGHAIDWAIVGIAIAIGAAVGAGTAAAQGANGQGIALAALAGALGGLFGGVGAWAGGAIGASASGLTGAAAAASTAATVGTFAGAVAGGAAGGAVGAAITGGDVAMGALTGAVSGAIAFGVAQFNIHVLQKALNDFSVSVIGGMLGGGVSAELHGGNFWEGAAYGAAGAAAGFSLTQFLSGLTRLNSVKQEADQEDIRLRSESRIDSQINDNKYGHANQMSMWQRALGLLAAPVLAVTGIGYEIYHFFVPGHVPGSPYGYTRQAPFYGLTDGQHPLNWIWDTPGDLIANTIGQFSGIFFSRSAAPYLNRSAFLIPGPDYRNSPWTDPAKPGAAWPW